MEKITVNNCKDITIAYNETLPKGMLFAGVLRSQAAAWQTVHQYCIQNGMKSHPKTTGIENVIQFIDDLKKKRK